MSRSRTILTLVLAAALLPACSDRSPTGMEAGAVEPRLLAQASLVAGAAVPDLGGAWNWSNVELLRMPRWFVQAMAPILGITPEGENTHARCESSGTMTLVQTGAAIEGTAVKTSNTCETRGGQLFQQPSSALQVADGRVAGGSIRFSFHTTTVKPCPHHAVIAEVQDGVAAVLSGAGHCVLPGHPQSQSPIALPPPPGGTSTTLEWQAWRP